MLSSVEVDQVESVLHVDGVLPQLLIDDPPAFDKISTCAESGILLAGIDTSNNKEVDVIFMDTLAEEGCKGVDHSVVNTVEEFRPVY